MKTRIFIIAAIAALSTSCLNDTLPEKVTPGTEPAVISTLSDTKTSLGEDGQTINWTATDQIKVFDNLNGANVFSTTEEDIKGSKAKFKGDVTEGTTQIIAVYPADLAKSANGNTVTVTVPTEQTAKAGSFAEGLNISVAKTDKIPGDPEAYATTFENVCGLLKFTIPSSVEGVTKVTISSNSVIAGDMTVDYSGETPVSAISTEGSKSISMEGSFAAGSTYWFVLAPVELDGISVVVTTADGTYSKSTDATIGMEAGKYKNLGTLEVEQDEPEVPETPKASATAAHAYTAGVLTGTTINVDLGYQAADINLQVVKNNSNDVLLSYSAAEVNGTVTIATDSNCPYLTSGEYTITGTYKQDGEEKTLEAIAFSVPAPFNTEKGEPALVAEYNLYTSYTKYAAGNVAEANSLSGDAIYMDLTSVNISDEILNKVGRAAVESTFNFDGKSLSGNGGKATVGATEFGAYTLSSVSSTFDGSSASTTTLEPTTYHITGLPYSYSFINSDQGANKKDNWIKQGWSVNGDVNTGITVGGLSIGGAIIHRHIYYVFSSSVDTGFIVSPKFHTPDNSSIKVNPSVAYHGYDMFTDSYDYTIYVGAVENTSVKNTESLTHNLKTITTSFDGASSNFNNGSFSLEAANPYISISSSSPSGSTTIVLSIHSAAFKYAE